MRLSLFFEDDLRLWSSSPEAPHIVGTSLFLLLCREFAPPKIRLESINSQITAIPNFLEDSKERITDPAEEAVEYLIQQTGMERQIATIEVDEYAERPTYFLSYYLGKHMIMKLKHDLMQKLGKDFDEKGFHETLLCAGNIPMRYVRRAVQEALNVQLEGNFI